MAADPDRREFPTSLRHNLLLCSILFPSDNPVWPPHLLCKGEKKCNILSREIAQKKWHSFKICKLADNLVIGDIIDGRQMTKVFLSNC